MSMSVLVAHYQ